MYNFSDPIYFLYDQNYDIRKKRLKEIKDVKELDYFKNWGAIRNLNLRNRQGF